MNHPVRVRFAPSPTGPLHIGGVRTALFNYLFAKKHQGTFVLRIEDTDQNRYVANAEKYIIDSLNWAEIPFDEGPGKEGKFGPYRQSERKEIYKQYAEELVKKGKAYYAFDTAEELEDLRASYEQKGETFIYNFHNRNSLNNSLKLSPEEVKHKIENGEKYVIRFKIPENEILTLNDLIRGEIKINTNTLDDKVLYKSDGMPTYHLANIVDDHLMEITHVIRGEEWLPSMALHELLYSAFGWEAPQFAHLPLILKPTGKGKLSKRDGDKEGFPVFPLAYTNEETGEVSRGYKEDGYYKEAFVNMLALLGWNPGTEQEIFNMDQLIKTFELEKVNKSGAKFDPEKTKWFQQQYLKSASNEHVTSDFKELLAKKNIVVSDEKLLKIVQSVKERAVFVKDLEELSDYFFTAPSTYEEKAVKKNWKEDTANLMQELMILLQNSEKFDSESLEKEVKAWIEQKEIGFGKIMQPLRLSLVGALKGAHLFDIMDIIGKEETILRIKNGIEKMG
ncbi:glutamate--tRNA ligase [Namhaeicola litoreus]|uniref:Glutamate--tRNA ligase n=1 Tax=Namhaeicola litoreus TaxID=1052145 RepID=A0ABW3XZL3_9FLAO